MNDTTPVVQSESKMSEAQQVQQPVVQPQQPEIQEITAKEKPKEKDPKRVAAGKRLAAISQKAKEEKMRRLLEQEEIISWKQCAILSMGIGVLGFAAYKYFWQQKKEEEFVHEKVHVEMKEESSKTKDKKEEEPQPKIKQQRGNEVRQSRGKPISMFDD